MESENTNQFEREWQEAFKDASMAPPDYLWENIERKLDEKERRRPFLFILKPSYLGMGVAAALLIFLGGMMYWAVQKNGFDNEKISLKTESAEIVKKSESFPNISTNTLPSEESKVIEKSSETLTHNSRINDERNLRKTFKTSFSKILKAERVTKKSGNDISQMADYQTNTAMGSEVLTIQPMVNSTDAFQRNLTTELRSVEPKSQVKYGNRFTFNRKYLLYDLPEETEEKLATNQQKFWIGMQSGGASFNPNIQAGSVEYSSSVKINNSTAGMPVSADVATANAGLSQNVVKNGYAINTGIALGYKLAKKWHIESGLRYLRGNSTIQSKSVSFTANHYNSSDFSNANNQYEFLMIPMQMAYEIPLTKNLRFDALAGFSTDIFLRNLIRTNQEKFIQRNGQNIYNSLNISGLGGVKLNYLIGKNWQTSLGTSFQQSILSGMNSATNLQMKMQMWGVNYGLTYRF